MDYRDSAVDRIHYLVSRAEELETISMGYEAKLLLKQASEIAEELRNGADSYGLFPVHY